MGPSVNHRLKAINIPYFFTTRKFFIILFLICFFMVIFFYLENKQILLLSISAFLLISFLVLRKPIIGIILFLFMLFFGEWLLFNILALDEKVFWIKEATLIPLALVAFTNIYNKELKKTPINLLVILYICEILLSFLVNGGTLEGFIAGLRRPLIFFLFFYILIYLNLSLDFYKKLIKALIIIGFIQIPFVFIEYYFYSPSLGRDRPGLGSIDFCTGTLGGSAQQALAFFDIAVISFLISFGFHYFKERLSQKKIIIGILALSIILPFANSGASFFYFIIVLGILIFFKIRKAFFKSLFFIGTAIFIFFIVIFKLGDKLNLYKEEIPGYSIYGYLDLKSSLSSNINMSTLNEANQGRIASIIYTFQEIKKDPYTLLFGFGPGNFTQSKFLDQKGAFFSDIGLMATRIQLSATLGEFGILGVIFNLLIIWKIFLMNIHLYKNIDDKYWKSISYGFNGMILLFVGGAIYIGTWWSPTLSFLFYMVFAGLYTARIQNNRERIMNRYCSKEG